MKTLPQKIWHAKEIIRKAIEKYPKIAVAVSWGKDSMVLLHLTREVKKDIEVFTVITPFHPKETLEFKDRIIREWNLNIKEYKSPKDPIPGLWRTNPNEYCRIFKVEPTKEAVKDLDAWISGLRRSEGSTRKNVQEFEKIGNIIKVNPILEWTELDY